MANTPWFYADGAWHQVATVDDIPVIDVSPNLPLVIVHKNALTYAGGTIGCPVAEPGCPFWDLTYVDDHLAPGLTLDGDGNIVFAGDVDGGGPIYRIDTWVQISSPGDATFCSLIIVCDECTLGPPDVRNVTPTYAGTGDDVYLFTSITTDVAQDAGSSTGAIGIVVGGNFTGDITLSAQLSVVLLRSTS